jgi:diguanylate cyclase
MTHDNIWQATMPAGLDDLMPDAGLVVQPPGAKIMLVDDDMLMTDIIQSHLEDRGYTRFIVTNDPREAMGLLLREEPDLLLLDLMMPQLNGFDVLEAIRADRRLRFLPVIVLTAASGAEVKLRALQLGATDFLAKPVDESELSLRVRNTLAYQSHHKRLLNHDLVTDLPGQRLFDGALTELMQSREGARGLLSLFSVNLPEGRLLRERLGQGEADSLARAIGLRLRRFVGQIALETPWLAGADRSLRVARLGPDDFGVLLEGLADARAVEIAAALLLKVLAEPLQLGQHTVQPKAWIGIGLAHTDGADAASLRKSADLAASDARERDTVQYQFASAELNRRSFERLTLGLQLRGAAQRGELRLHYQPKVDMMTGRIVGAEALVRWQHAELGLVPPGQFIPLAEELGLIGEVGQWVIDQACRDAALWCRAGFEDITVAINAAKPQFLSSDLCAALTQATSSAGLPPGQVVVELTESMLMTDVAQGLALMQDLKRLGVALSIDDFGTGYSSLNYLKRFPLDELKIDRSFVTDLPGRRADSAIVRTIIDLGHSLGMRVTAEGVETEAQLNCLKALGCDTYQGFLFGRPVPLEDFLRELGVDPSDER